MCGGNGAGGGGGGGANGGSSNAGGQEGHCGGSGSNGACGMIICACVYLPIIHACEYCFHIESHGAPTAGAGGIRGTGCSSAAVHAPGGSGGTAYCLACGGSGGCGYPYLGNCTTGSGGGGGGGGGGGPATITIIKEDVPILFIQALGGAGGSGGGGSAGTSYCNNRTYSPNGAGGGAGGTFMCPGGNGESTTSGWTAISIPPFSGGITCPITNPVLLCYALRHDESYCFQNIPVSTSTGQGGQGGQGRYRSCDSTYGLQGKAGVTAVFQQIDWTTSKYTNDVCLPFCVQFCTCSQCCGGAGGEGGCGGARGCYPGTHGSTGGDGSVSCLVLCSTGRLKKDFQL